MKTKAKTKAKTNNERLHELVEEYGLGRRDIARLTGYPIAKNGQFHAGNNWLADPGKINHRKMPAHALELIELKLSMLTKKERAAFEGKLDKAKVIAKNRLKRRCEQPGYVPAADR